MAKRNYSFELWPENVYRSGIIYILTLYISCNYPTKWVPISNQSPRNVLFMKQVSFRKRRSQLAGLEAHTHVFYEIPKEKVVYRQIG